MQIYFDVPPEIVLTGREAASSFFLLLGAGVTPAAGAGRAAPHLVEPLAVVPAEDFRGVRIADGLWRCAPSLVPGPSGEVNDELLVGDLSDRVAVLRLMRFASGYLAVSGIGRGLVTFFWNEFQVREIVRLAVVQVLLPMFAKIREQRR